ncbi:MAG: 16S rRNA (cytosine(967)-C(5))-methyltransferase RsmB [Firmicutes bacterium]|nr:16S rRNA (cytosine(967)-C(5))-methyltransferase RsmB [Bacillota bacterium]
MTPFNPRQAAVDALIRWERSDIFIDDAVDLMLRDYPCDSGAEASGYALDRALSATLLYGVVERKITLDYIIPILSGRDLSSLDKQTLNVLRVGLYQLLYLDKIPSYAAVNETVSCAPQRSRGLVNAVLRQMLRRGGKPFYPNPDDGLIHYLSVKCSLPEWIISEWTNDYGEKTAVFLASETFNRRPMTLRVNTTRTSCEELLEKLQSAGIEAFHNACVPDMIDVSSGSVTRFPGYGEGLFFVEDAASRICASILGAMPGDTVIDTCSAPGGKSFSLAIDMGCRGTIYSFDVSQKKKKLIDEGVSRLGLDIIKSDVCDGKQPKRELFGCADAVLCDVPCSGLGVISKKPDIRYKEKKSIERLPDIGFSILSASADYVKGGGRLVYSTCTLRRAENEAVTEKFLASHGDFSPAPIHVCGIDAACGQITLMPHIHGTDGFYIASFIKNKN